MAPNMSDMTTEQLLDERLKIQEERGRVQQQFTKQQLELQREIDVRQVKDKMAEIVQGMTPEQIDAVVESMKASVNTEEEGDG